MQVKGLPALECRSFKYQNDGPLRFGRMFPGWNLAPTLLLISGEAVISAVLTGLIFAGGEVEALAGVSEAGACCRNPER
jgi:hypothetical protein